MERRLKVTWISPYGGFRNPKQPGVGFPLSHSILTLGWNLLRPAVPARDGFYKGHSFPSHDPVNDPH